MSEQDEIYVDDCALCGREVPLDEMYPMGADPRLCCVSCAEPRGYLPSVYGPGPAHQPGVYSEGNPPQIGVTAEEVDPVAVELARKHRQAEANRRRGITALT